MIMAIQVDHAQRLGVVSSRPRNDWLENQREVVRRGRVVLEPIDDDPRASFTSRIDVIDLDSGSIIVSSERDELIHAFIGEGLGIETRYTESGIPQVVIWSMTLELAQINAGIG
jgi:hypothetical protein